jgi:dTDP-4-dehydrorhamnose 3,5-epimerase-like enzyme
MSLDKCKIINIPTINDERGDLSFFETNQEIPFDIKRVYYVYNIPSTSIRGAHAHKELNQVMIALSGKFKALLDDGKNKQEFVLSKANQGLFITNMIWRELYDFSEDAVCLVFANMIYSESDYIRSYDEYISSIIKV